jgi:ribonuclease-3
VSDAETAARAQQAIGYTFQNPDLLLLSLTHASIADSRVKSNERLEFLGDSILGLIVCEELFRRFGDWLEGDLTKVKSFVVSRRVCAEMADQSGLTDLLILGNGIEQRTTLPTSLRAAVLESVIGAIYLDGGLDAVKRFIMPFVTPFVDRAAASDNHENYKSVLQQFAQRRLAASPQYLSLDEQGPDHSKCFEVCVLIDGRRFPSAWGTSKKAAEQEAARRALECLEGREKSENLNQ